MANNVYNVNSLGSAASAVIVTDDGTGIDWLTITGSFLTYTSINLEYTYAQDGTATSAWGRFDTAGPPATTTLRINGIIENVRGSDTTDFIGGNHANNLIYGDAASTGVGGNDTINADYGDDTIYGGSGADSLLGAGDDDLLFGNSGADTIGGNDGVDVVNGGLGADSLSGGGQSRDTVTYSDSNAGVRLLINFGTTTTGIGGHAQGDRINGFTDVIGSNFNDIIRDSVAGTVAFGYNANQFFGGDGDDQLFLGGGNDTGSGGAGKDFVLGEIGNDVLIGGTGDDTLRGGTGADSLTGGAQADTFQFQRVTDSTVVAAERDRIADFRRVEGDRIDLSLIDARTNTASINDAFTFIGQAAFNHERGELRWQDAGANLLVQADLNGDGTADMSVLVVNLAGLLASDFLL